MSPVKLNKWRFSSRILMPIFVAVVTTVLLVGAILTYATHESDRIAVDRQGRLVTHVLLEHISKISHDQESVSVWDDAVQNTRIAVNHEWIESNIGVWLYDYFGHDQAFVLDENAKLVYAMSAGATVDPSAYRPAQGPLAPLIRELRSALRLAGPSDRNEPGRFNATDLLVIQGRPAIASVVPLLSDTGRIEQPAGTEYLHVSIRFLDGSFLAGLMRDYLFDAARFAWTGDTLPGEAAYPLRTDSGAVLGYFIWKPERPGYRMLVRMAPVLVAALLVVAIIITLLVRRIRNAATELQASEAQAQHLAFHDQLTGLPNRALFNVRLERALIDARATGASVALLYLDLDRFKNVNDTLGHPAGDALIGELARRLTGLIRDSDNVARLGGDEFGIIQANVAETRDVSALCERVIQAVAAPFEIVGSSAFVGVSIGVAIAPEAGTHRADLVRKADIALYRAKLAGRNRFQVFSEEMDASVQRRRTIEAELREALCDGDQFQLAYQPVYCAQSGAMVGVEALLRWKNPTQGWVDPGNFIPIAEETGLIHAIGQWVLEEACSAGARWKGLSIAVNVSPVQFRSAGFGATVLAVLERTGMNPSQLELEITESVLLDFSELSALTFETFRAAGVRVALDDFGTGYSSLTYLRKYPVDRIKIDRSFVRALQSDPAAEAIVQAIVDLARAIGVDVTAEGVETTVQLDVLKRIGCTELQGFLLSRPLRADRIDSMFNMPRRTVIGSRALKSA